MPNGFPPKPKTPTDRSAQIRRETSWQGIAFSIEVSLISIITI